MRKISLRVGETEAILMAKGMVKLDKATIVVRDKARLEESMGAIAIPQNPVR